MPARTLARLVGTDSEDELDFASTATHSKATRMAPSKARGRPTVASKVTKPAQKSDSRRSSGRIAAVVAKVEEREALSEKSANMELKTAEGAKEDTAKPKARRGRPPKAVASEADENDIPARKTGPQPKRGRPAKKPVTEMPEIQMPDPEPMDLDETINEGSDESIVIPPAEEPAAVLPDEDEVSIEMGRNHNEWTTGESSMMESDASLRRKLGDLTRKHDALEAKYQTLKEVGVKEAEKNFDKLKRQTDERASTATTLIASLKAELATQAALAREGAKYKQQLDASENRIGALQQNIADLTKALSDTKVEIKTLSTKLAASRAAEAPSSALKGGSSARPANQQEIVQAMQLKEDLYGDLTGLIVRGIKHEGNEDVYDCIQTGRNGTLHFKLAIAEDRTGDSYEDTQFTYRPQLDENRDRDLIEVLPDYLAEEITFPRPQAAKFYARVTKSLTERMEES